MDMRFGDRITFVQETETFYDPTQGRWVEGKVVHDKQPCHLSTLGTERTNQLFGQIDKHVTVARLQRPYLREFSHALVDGKRFEVQRQSNYKKGVLYLEATANG